jgi:hypothetical protein
MVRRGMKRRGISDVVVTVLLVLLVVVAVAIIWGFISSFLRSTDKIDTNTLNTALSIQAKSVTVNWNGTLSFNAKMDMGESVDRVQITLYDSSGNTKMIYRNTSFQKLEVKRFYIDSGEHGLADIAKIAIAPIIETQTGLQVGTMQGEYNINQLDVKPGCGNAKIDSGEECDNGKNNLNSVLRESLVYNTNSTYCNIQCLLNTTRGPYCGDSIIDNTNGGNEQCDNGTSNVNGVVRSSIAYNSNSTYCNLQCLLNTARGPYCGDGIKDSSAGETCDNATLNGQAITKAQVSYGSTGYYCNSICQQVAVAGPRCGDGIIDSPNEDCEGSNLNGETCMSKGYYSGTLSCSSCKFDISQCYLPTSGLKAYWKFDESTGSTTASDSSGNGNTLTVNSGSKFVTNGGKRGNGIRFHGQGSNGGASKNNFEIAPYESTISFWANLSSMTNCQNNICTAINSNTGGSDGWIMIRYNSAANGIEFIHTGLSVTVPYSSDFNNWVNYVMAWNNTRYGIYRNGILNQSGAMSPISSSGGITIGANGQNFRVFNGTIDEVVIWNRTLNATEISQIYSRV